MYWFKSQDTDFQAQARSSGFHKISCTVVTKAKVLIVEGRVSATLGRIEGICRDIDALNDLKLLRCRNKTWSTDSVGAKQAIRSPFHGSVGKMEKNMENIIVCWMTIL